MLWQRRLGGPTHSFVEGQDHVLRRAISPMENSIITPFLDRAPSRRTKHLLLQPGPNPARAVGMNGSQKPQKSKMGSFALRKLARKQSKPATLPESPTLLSAAVIRCSSSPPPPPAQREQDPGSSVSSPGSAPSTTTPPAPTGRFRLGKSTPSPLGSWTPDRRGLGRRRRGTPSRRSCPKGRCRPARSTRAGPRCRRRTAARTFGTRPLARRRGRAPRPQARAACVTVRVRLTLTPTLTVTLILTLTLTLDRRRGRRAPTPRLRPAGRAREPRAGPRANQRARRRADAPRRLGRPTRQPKGGEPRQRRPALAALAGGGAAQ